MINVDPRALWVANSAFNGAGVVAAASAWSSVFDGKGKRLLWLAPALLISAWLETNFNFAFAGAASMSLPMYRHLAIDLAAFSGLALVFVFLRRKATIFTTRSAKSASSGTAGVGAAKAISNPQLREAMASLLNSADQADVTSLAEIYASDFLSVRVADEGGGLGSLTREQMLAFLAQAVKSASGKAGADGHAAVKTGETVIHHAEIDGDTAFVLMIRVKDLGNGWEPMFYTLIWKKQNGRWRLLREFVHQKTVPQWS